MPILGGCLCFDLPTGSKIIGALYLFAAILNTLSLACINLLLWVFDFVPQILKMFEGAVSQHQHSGGSEGFTGTPSSNSFVNDDDDYFDHSDHHDEGDQQLKDAIEMIREHIFALKIAFLVLLCLALLSIITSSLLIHGVRKSRRGMLVPWVMQELIHLIIAIAIIVVVFILFGAIKVSWMLVIPILLSAFIQIFFILVVISQFQALGLIRMHDEMCMK